VAFINQFLPDAHKIDFYAWDFKKVSKSKSVRVVDELAVIAGKCAATLQRMFE
jgi:hypothetical protein